MTVTFGVLVSGEAYAALTQYLYVDGSADPLMPPPYNIATDHPMGSQFVINSPTDPNYEGPTVTSYEFWITNGLSDLTLSLSDGSYLLFQGQGGVGAQYDSPPDMNPNAQVVAYAFGMSFDGFNAGSADHWGTGSIQGCYDISGGFGCATGSSMDVSLSKEVGREVIVPTFFSDGSYNLDPLAGPIVVKDEVGGPDFLSASYNNNQLTMAMQGTVPEGTVQAISWDTASLDVNSNPSYLDPGFELTFFDSQGGMSVVRAIQSREFADFVDIVTYDIINDPEDLKWKPDIRLLDPDILNSDEIRFNAAAPVPEVPAGALAPLMGLIGAGAWFIRRRVKK